VGRAAFPLAVTATPAEVGTAPILLRGDPAGAFRQAAELGCAGVEIHVREAADVDARAIRRLMADYRLEVPTLGTGMAATVDGLSFAHAEAEVRRRAVERVCGHVELAAELGSAVTIGSVSGRLGVMDEAERARRRQAALEALAAVCARAGRLGVTVLLEPLNRYECDYLNTLAEARRAAEEIGAGNLRLLADTFHMNIEERDLAASFRAAAERLGHVHLADSNRQAPGRGHLDVAAVLRVLEEIGYRGFISFEVFPIPDAVTAVREGIRTIQRAAGEDMLAEKGK